MGLLPYLCFFLSYFISSKFIHTITATPVGVCKCAEERQKKTKPVICFLNSVDVRD